MHSLENYYIQMMPNVWLTHGKMCRFMRVSQRRKRVLKPAVTSPWENVTNTQNSVLVHWHKSLFSTTLFRLSSGEGNRVRKLSRSRKQDIQTRHEKRKRVDTDLKFSIWFSVAALMYFLASFVITAILVCFYIFVVGVELSSLSSHISEQTDN